MSLKRQSLGTIREFRTANFRVIVDAIEDYDIDLSWDETGEVREKLESGEYISFCARARVIHDDLGQIASDYLGGCVYGSLKEFEDHRERGARNRELAAEGVEARCGSYFADMVSTVCREARKRMLEVREGLNGLHIRAA